MNPKTHRKPSPGLRRSGLLCLVFALALGAAAHAGPGSPPSPLPAALSGASPEPPAIATLLKPEQLRKMIADRDIETHASLDSAGDGGLKRYSYYASMLVHASLKVSREVLTDYRLYAKMIPYIDRASYEPATRLLDLEGGIWKFRMRSLVRFEERGDRWIHYRIVAGHFAGLEGDAYFESAGEQGTLVYFSGAQTGKAWPPAFVIERGAEIVFGFTAKRMRSYIESRKTGQDGGETNRKSPSTYDPAQTPQPRSHL